MALITNLSSTSTVDIIDRAGVKHTIAASGTLTLPNENLLYTNFEESVESGFISVTGWVDPNSTIAGTSVTGSSGNIANASAIATIPAVAGYTAWCTGFQITASGATAASVVSPTLAGGVSGTLTYTFAVPAGVAVSANSLIVTFNPPIPASAVNTAFTLTLPALGSGNTNATVNIQGIYL